MRSFSNKYTVRINVVTWLMNLQADISEPESSVEYRACSPAKKSADDRPNEWAESVHRHWAGRGDSASTMKIRLKWHSLCNSRIGKHVTNAAPRDR